jgi:hypothetical protein
MRTYPRCSAAILLSLQPQHSGTSPEPFVDVLWTAPPARDDGLLARGGCAVGSFAVITGRAQAKIALWGGRDDGWFMPAGFETALWSDIGTVSDKRRQGVWRCHTLPYPETGPHTLLPNHSMPGECAGRRRHGPRYGGTVCSAWYPTRTRRWIEKCHEGSPDRGSNKECQDTRHIQNKTSELA